MNKQIEQKYSSGNLTRVALALAAAVLVLGVAGNVQAAPPIPNEKCGTAVDFTFDPGSTVTEGTNVTITQEITVSSEGSGSQDCELGVGDLVNDGNARIQAVELAGEPRPCADQNASFCTAGLTGNSCALDSDCDTALNLGDGICTDVDTSMSSQENPSDGFQQVNVDTTGLGGTVLGFVSQYAGQGKYEGAPAICTDLTVVAEEEECEGATISIARASGPGEPTAPGGAYDWTFRVTVHACEDLYGVTAQGGTNGWAQLVGRSAASLSPSGTTTAAIRNANKKTDVILWTIGDMEEGDTETLDVALRGSLKGAPDCDERFLSGAWSALFSLDGLVFEKSDYTGRVSIFTNSNGVEGDCP